VQTKKKITLEGALILHKLFHEKVEPVEGKAHDKRVSNLERLPFGRDNSTSQSCIGLEKVIFY
jgi:hypothetical protein